MYEYGFPFDNAGITSMDRNAGSDEFADYLETITGMEHGVYPNPSTGLQVTAGGGLNVKIGAGACMIKGRIKRLLQDTTVTLQAAENMDRIDRIVMRLDKSIDQRRVAPYVLKGTAATSPVAPALTRSGDIYEIALADVRVSRMAASVSQAQITDLRANTDLCGYMPVFGSFDTTSLFNQYQDALNKYLDLVDAALDDTAVGHLQGQIDEVRGDLRKVTDDTLYEDLTLTCDFADLFTTLEKAPHKLNNHTLKIIINVTNERQYLRGSTITGFSNGALIITPKPRSTTGTTGGFASRLVFQSGSLHFKENYHTRILLNDFGLEGVGLMVDNCDSFDFSYPLVIGATDPMRFQNINRVSVMVLSGAPDKNNNSMPRMTFHNCRGFIRLAKPSFYIDDSTGISGGYAQALTFTHVLVDVGSQVFIDCWKDGVDFINIGSTLILECDRGGIASLFVPRGTNIESIKQKIDNDASFVNVGYSAF